MILVSNLSLLVFLYACDALQHLMNSSGVLAFGSEYLSIIFMRTEFSWFFYPPSDNFIPSVRTQLKRMVKTANMYIEPTKNCI